MLKECLKWLSFDEVFTKFGSHFQGFSFFGPHTVNTVSCV